MGYAGGTKKNPTYYSLGDHSEAIEIEFDPQKISFKKLIDMFWESHEPTDRPLSRQYASFVFFHTDEQKRIAHETKEQVEAKKGRPVYTKIVPAGFFYPAEEYHQKYYLRKYGSLVQELTSIYSGDSNFTKSTAAAKINGYLGGNGTLEELKRQLKDIGLPDEVIDRIVVRLRGASR